VRQHGLLIGVDLSGPVAAAAVTAALKHGCIINNTGPDRIRLAPPLILTEEQAAAFGEAWPRILDEAFSEGTS
jgi:acetylornithine aminotransferase